MISWGVSSASIGWTLGLVIMSPEAVIFIIAIAFSLLAFSITMMIVPVGAVELNPIGAFWISSGLPYLGFAISWTMIYLFFRFLVLKNKEVPEKYRFMLLGTLFGITFADFLFDSFSYIYIISH